MALNIVDAFQDFLRSVFYGPNGGLTKDNIINLGRRDKFSDHLRYKVYDPTSRAYYNNDNSIGYMWECSPLVYAGEDVYNVLQGLIGLGVPEHTTIQFFLLADPYINHILDYYKVLKTYASSFDLGQKTIDNIVDFYKAGAENGMAKCQDIPVRNFRLIVSIKFPGQQVGLDNPEIQSIEDLLQVLDSSRFLNIRDSVTEILSGAKLFPHPLEPEVLIRTLARIFNDRDFDDVGKVYDDTIPINKQIIMADTPISFRSDHVKVGKKYFRCLTPKNNPQNAFSMLTNYIHGGIKGVVDDNNQIHVPFFSVFVIHFEEMKQYLHNKCNASLMQNNFGSFALAQQRRKDEYMWATSELEKTPFVKVMPAIWVYSHDEDKCREAIARTKRLWQQYGFTMQEEIRILQLLFPSCFPMGLIADKDLLKTIEREFTVHAPAATNLIPAQGDFAGGGKPALLFMGRKGQLISLDLFDPLATNYNSLIMASSGTGKSFFTQSLVYNYYLMGSFIRIIDIGFSYKKLCNILGGTYLTFGPQSNIVLNPFSNVKVDDLENDISVISAIVQQMIFSSTKAAPDKNEISLIKDACRWAYEEMGSDACIDDVARYLREFPRLKSKSSFTFEDTSGNNITLNIIKNQAHTLAFNMIDYTKTGTYGRFFNGRSTLDISHDRFVVLELEELKPVKDLFSVIILQILNYITYDTYLSDRSTQRFIIFDEAWQFLQKDGSTNTQLLSGVISEGYRRARKYSASFSAVTQSILDIDNFGEVGNVLFANSAFKFYLSSPDYDKARESKRINYDPAIHEILKSVQTPRPKYSEIFLDTPYGVGVSRLIMDPFSYFLFTSDGKENAMINKIVNQGYSYADAIGFLVEEARKKEEEAKLKCVNA